MTTTCKVMTKCDDLMIVDVHKNGQYKFTIIAQELTWTDYLYKSKSWSHIMKCLILDVFGYANRLGLQSIYHVYGVTKHGDDHLFDEYVPSLVDANIEIQKRM